jgi:DNA-binding NtrC family response regulator
MKPARVFLIDDDDTLRKVLSRELSELGFEVEAFAGPSGVLDALGHKPPQGILLDLRLRDTSGLDLLTAIRNLDADQQVVVFTGHGSIEQAVQAMRMGAHDFLTKPVRLDVLEQSLRRACDTHALLVENRRLRRVAGADARPAAILGHSRAIRELIDTIGRVAKSSSNVLVQGENGTGKELVARAIHAASTRADEPFVVANCAALPEALVESELFGHEKGAFTGADKKRIGLFEAAHGGTLFLDELGEMPRVMQPTLLRAMQSGEIRPVGSDRVRTVDVRVVSATNRNLMTLVDEGAFREDLYYRAATLHVEVPPLRARIDDVPDLVRAFVLRSATRLGRSLQLSDAAIQRLTDHSWPGNVRELENAAERLCVMAESTEISAEMVDRYVLQRARAPGELPSLDLDTLESIAIEAALKRHGGDKKAAAATLGIALKTLYNKLERLHPKTP